MRALQVDQVVNVERVHPLTLGVYREERDLKWLYEGDFTGCTGLQRPIYKKIAAVMV